MIAEKDSPQRHGERREELDWNYYEPVFALFLQRVLTLYRFGRLLAPDDLAHQHLILPSHDQVRDDANRAKAVFFIKTPGA
jgi:hypothetical protein